MQQRRKKQNVLGKILPEMATKVAEVTGREEPDIDDAIARIMNNVLVERRIEANGDGQAVSVVVENNSSTTETLEITDIVSAEPRKLSDGATVVEMDGEWFVKWEADVGSGDEAELEYEIADDAAFDLDVKGVESETHRHGGRPMSTQKDQQAREQLIDLAAQFYDQFELGEIPHMSVPTRTKNNIEYDEGSGVWVYGDRESTRSANSVRGARKLLKAVYTIEFLADQLEDRSSTLRELYYLSEMGQQGSPVQRPRRVERADRGSRDRFGSHPRGFPHAPRRIGCDDNGTVASPRADSPREREIHCQKTSARGTRFRTTPIRSSFSIATPTSCSQSRPAGCATDSSRTVSTTSTTP